MSLFPNIIQNLRERVTSGDINDMQSMQSGQTSKALLALASQAGLIGGPGGPADSRSLVGGFDLPAPGAADQLDINAGTLMQYAPSLTPAPGTYDSPFRVASSEDQTIPLPTPVLPTWYVLEARWVQPPIVTQTRGIRSTITGLFVPTVVPKLDLPTVEFQLTAGVGGGPIPQPSAVASGWVPLFAIYRPAGSSVFDPLTQSWDLRCSIGDAGARGFDSAFVQLEADCYCDGTNLTILKTSVPGRVVGRPVIVPPQSFDPATILATGGAIVGATTYYVYAYLWNALPTRRYPVGGSVIANDAEGNAQLVMSTVAPVQAPGGAWVAPGFGIQPQGEFFNSNVQGVLVCSLRRNSGNTAWIGLRQIGRHVWTGDNDYLTTFTNPAGMMSVVPPMPTHARTLDLRILWVNDNAAGPSQARTFVTSFGTYLNVIDIGRVPGVASSRGTSWFTAVDGAAANFSLPLYSFGAGGNDNWVFEVLGYSW